MENLLPEWEDTSSVNVELQLPTGEVKDYHFTLPVKMTPLLSPESKIKVPSPGSSGFLYDFLDLDKQIAYLRVDKMSHYREVFEGSARGARYTSATETFRSLVVDMKNAGTSTWQIMNDASKRAGLNKRVYPHLLRHSEAIHRLRMTGNPKALQHHLGYSSTFP